MSTSFRKQQQTNWISMFEGCLLAPSKSSSRHFWFSVPHHSCSPGNYYPTFQLWGSQGSHYFSMTLPISPGMRTDPGGVFGIRTLAGGGGGRGNVSIQFSCWMYVARPCGTAAARVLQQHPSSIHLSLGPVVPPPFLLLHSIAPQLSNNFPFI